jgi:hypothetical protein
VFSETSVGFQRLDGFIPQEIEIFIITAVKTLILQSAIAHSFCMSFERHPTFHGPYNSELQTPQ